MRVRLKVRDNRIGLRFIHYTWPEWYIVENSILILETRRRVLSLKMLTCQFMLTSVSYPPSQLGITPTSNQYNRTNAFYPCTHPVTLLYCDEVSCKSQVLNHKYPARMIRCSEALDASYCFDCSLASVCSHQLSYYSVLVACANVVGPCFRFLHRDRSFGGKLRIATRQSSTNGDIHTFQRLWSIGQQTNDAIREKLCQLLSLRVLFLSLRLIFSFTIGRMLTWLEVQEKVLPFFLACEQMSVSNQLLSST